MQDTALKKTINYFIIIEFITFIGIWWWIKLINHIKLTIALCEHSPTHARNALRRQCASRFILQIQMY